VKDDGPGIDPEYHKKIFEIFQTLMERDAFESTGIGLSIVKKIIDEKGGEIKVDSSLGAGASFCFTWPKFGESPGE
jgi:signal transduction histidine kinase